MVVIMNLQSRPQSLRLISNRFFMIKILEKVLPILLVSLVNFNVCLAQQVSKQEMYEVHCFLTDNCDPKAKLLRKQANAYCQAYNRENYSAQEIISIKTKGYSDSVNSRIKKAANATLVKEIIDKTTESEYKYKFFEGFEFFTNKELIDKWSCPYFPVRTKVDNFEEDKNSIAELIWKQKLGEYYYSTPVVVENVIYFASNKGFYAFNLEGLELLWEIELDDLIVESLTYANNFIFMATGRGAYAIDLKSRGIAWYFHKGGVNTKISVDGEIAYFLTSFRKGGRLHAVDINTGEQKWQYYIKRPVYSAPQISNGVVYFGSNDNNFYAIKIPTELTSGRGYKECVNQDKKDGKPRLTITSNEKKLRPEKKWCYITGGSVNSDSVIHNNKVIFGGTDGFIYSLNKFDGKLVWKLDINSGVGLSSDLIGDTIIFARSDYLYSVDIKKGELNWKCKVKGMVVSDPVVSGTTIYVGSRDHYLYAFDLNTGVEKWAFKADAPISSKAAVYNGIVYFGSVGGTVYAIRDDSK